MVIQVDFTEPNHWRKYNASVTSHNIQVLVEVCSSGLVRDCLDRLGDAEEPSSA